MNAHHLSRCRSRSRNSYRCIHLLVALGLSCPALTVRADPPARRVAVLPLTRQGATDAQASAVRQAMTTQLGRLGLSALAPAEVERLMMLADLSCTTRACLLERARTMKADLLVGGRLSRTRAGGLATWTLECWLFDVVQRETVVTIRDQCGACSAAQTRDWANRTAARLLSRSRTVDQRVRLVVASRPSGAVILLDGSAVGATPMTLWVAPGEHTLVLRKSGYRLGTRQVTARFGEVGRVELGLEGSRPPGGGADDRSRRGLRVLKWVTLAAAVASLATGIALLALHGRSTCDAGHPAHECAELYDTAAPGALVTAVGGLAAVGAGVMFYLDRDGGRAPRRTALILPTGGNGPGISALLRF